MSSKSNIVSEKDFYKIKAGTTLFSPKIDQFGKLTLVEYYFEGKRIKANPDSIWMDGYTTPVFIFHVSGDFKIGLLGRYPEHHLLFWTRRSALNYAQDVKDGARSSEKLHWVRRVRRIRPSSKCA